MDPLVAEIRLVSFDFAPENWALCNGQLLSVQDYPALFSVINNSYGGDGKTTFALPDLRGRAPMLVDKNNVKLGEKIGSATNILVADQLPSHTHEFRASTLPGTVSTGNPTNNIFGNTGTGDTDYATYPQQPNPPLIAMSPNVIDKAGSAAPVPNMMPSLGLNFMIALHGIYPPKP